jgi:hypothetical protein
MAQLKRGEKWLGNEGFKAGTISVVALAVSSYFWSGETWQWCGVFAFMFVTMNIVWDKLSLELCGHNPR